MSALVVFAISSAGLGPIVGAVLALVAGPPAVAPPAEDDGRARIEFAPRFQPAKTKTATPPALSVARPAKDTTHALTWRTKLFFVPNFILAKFLDAYSNSLCRQNPGQRAHEMGAHRVDGCNFMVDVGYRHEMPKLAIETSLGYGRLFLPDSNWLGAGEKLPSADFLQIRLHILNAQVTLSRDFALDPRHRFFWRVGGHVGVAFIAGNVYRTKLGDQAEGCSINDLGDLDRCRPYRALEFNEEHREPRYFASCDEDGCDDVDLQRAGRYADDSFPRVLPLVGVFTGPRMRVLRNLAIAAEFGISLGFTVGISVDGYFNRDGGRRRADRAKKNQSNSSRTAKTGGPHYRIRSGAEGVATAAQGPTGTPSEETVGSEPRPAPRSHRSPCTRTRPKKTSKAKRRSGRVADKRRRSRTACPRD